MNKQTKHLLKRGLASVLSLTMCVSMLQLTVFAAEGETTKKLICEIPEHAHTTDCYKLTCTTEIGSGAVDAHACEYTHEHNEGCGYVEAKDEVVCSCVDTDEDGEINHGDDCGYQPAVQGQPCTDVHEHNDSCKYVEAVEGHVHGSNCYATEATCGKEVHEHSEGCYTTSGNVGDQETKEPEQTGTFTMEKIADGEYKVTGKGVFAGEFIYDGKQGSWTALGYMAVKKLILDEGITGIADKTFVDAWVSRSMKEIVLPDTLTTIGVKAFQGGILEKINLEHVTSVGARAFEANMGLTELTIPAGLEIGEEAFSDVKVLKTLTIEEGVISIGDAAFQICSALETVVLPQSLETIGKSAFSNCTALTTISMAGEEPVMGTAHIADVESIGDQALEGAGMEILKLENVGTIGGTLIGASYINLEKVILENVETVSNYAFRYANFKTVEINNVETIGDYAFYASDLETVTMDTVGSVGKLAFYYDNNLEEVSLTNVKKIGDQAFYLCSALENLTVNGTDTIGAYAFYKCQKLTNVSLDDIGTIGTMAFAYNYYLTDLSLYNIGTIGQKAFYGAGFYADYYNQEALALNMGTVGTISAYAFSSCTGLTAIDSLKNVGRIDGFAFYGCSNLSGLTVEDATKMGFNGNYGDVMARVQAILEGKFKLDDAAEIVKLTPTAGWEDSKVAENENWNSYDNQTQLVEQARWQGENSTTAEVKVDAYYTAEKQMDYIFVADLSASMAQLGNAADENSRFYDMQSKLLDMTSQLLDSKGYDCRVAIVTFGGALDANNPGTSKTMDFTKDVSAVKTHINSLEPLYENTDYGLGMQAAQKLVKANTGRNTVVVFLSDGQPYTLDGVDPTSGDLTGTRAAAEINVPIYGVLHSPGAAHDVALAAMKAICGEYTVYEATDTESFGKAMNDAFTAVYGTHTVTIPVHTDFENVRDLTVSASAGEASYDADSHTITWELTGMPFTKHTLTYSMTLKSDLANRTGTYTYDVNSGKADIDRVVSVETPQLTRTVSSSGSGSTTYTLTINYVDAEGNTMAGTVTRTMTSGSSYSVTSPVIDGYTASQAVVSGTMPASNVTVTVVYTADDVEIPEENPPLSENPDVEIPDEDPPMAENPEEDIPDENVPLDGTPKTGDSSHTVLWGAVCVLSMGGLIVLLGKKREDEEV